MGLRDTPTPAQAGLAASEAAHSLGLGLGPVWHTDRTGFVATGNWLAMVAGSLGKIGQDIALMAQGDEIALRGAGTSSAMAHKSNPVGAEITVALARHVAHMQGLLAQAMIHEQERSGSAWALEWMCLPTMVEGTGAATRHVLALIRGVDRLGPAPPT